jgi:site-specific DNA-cytosine methylase
MPEISENNLMEETFEMFPLETFQVPTSLLEDSLARLFQSQVSELDSLWMTPEGHSLLKCLDSLTKNQYLISSLRMSKDSSITTGGRTFEIILEVLDGLGYDCQWELLDSQNFGVPQHRERIFLIGHLRGKPRPKVFPIGRASRSNDETNSQERKGREGFFSDISPTLDAHYYKGGNARQYVVQTESRRDKEMRTYTEGVVPTLTAQMGTGGGNVPYVRAMLDVARVNKSPNGRLIKDDGDPMYTITAQDRHGVQIGDEDGFAIRKLTPLECERLQGLPDGWTEFLS